MVEKRAASRVWWRIDQQFCCDDACLYPAIIIRRAVAFSVAPPRKLTWWLFAALINDCARRRRELLALGAVQYRPPDSDHAPAVLSARFPIQGESQAAMFSLQTLAVSFVSL